MDRFASCCNKDLGTFASCLKCIPSGSCARSFWAKYCTVWDWAGLGATASVVYIDKKTAPMPDRSRHPYAPRAPLPWRPHLTHRAATKLAGTKDERQPFPLPRRLRASCVHSFALTHCGGPPLIWLARMTRKDDKCIKSGWGVRRPPWPSGHRRTRAGIHSTCFLIGWGGRVPYGPRVTG
eukprot:gene5492-biopygen4229